MRTLYQFALALFITTLSACGGDKSEKKAAPIPLGAMTQVFVNASNTYQIPMNILLALAYKESGLHTTPSQVSYGAGDSFRGPAAGQTMIGLSFKALGINEESAADPSVQLSAYGSWVQQGLRQQKINLPFTIRKNDDIYDWIWQLARLHHPDTVSSKNLQIIFAREMMETLNQGFIWQNAESRERITLAPQLPKLETGSFSAPIQANLQLDTRKSEIFSVDYMQLTYSEESGEPNQPKRIEVIHCPFSLSTCLGAQEGSDVQLQAHYIIPPDESLLSDPIKVLQHRSRVSVTNTSGENVKIGDAVVIMLVGNSGRYTKDQREESKPSWYTKKQLKDMGDIIAGVCQLMSKDDPSIDYQRCRSEGVSFRHGEPAATFRFGDIPDFDPSIFWSFVTNPSGTSGEVTMQLPQGLKLFQSGSGVNLTIGFITGTAKLIIEHLERCGTGKTVWTTTSTQFIRNEVSKNIEVKFFDQGPNLNGQHFVRALAYDAQGKLMGWAIQDFFLNNYDTSGVPGPGLRECSL